VARALVEIVRQAPRLPGDDKWQAVRLPYNPFAYEKRATETIERDGVRLGGEELIRVIVRQRTFDKVAHKIDRLGDYKPEIVYEKARIQEIDPRDDGEVARLNQSEDAQIVTVRDDVDLPVIAAFRLLAARVAPRHPILLKDSVVGTAR